MGYITELRHLTQILITFSLMRSVYQIVMLFCKQKAISILLSIVVSAFASHYEYAYSCLLQVAHTCYQTGVLGFGMQNTNLQHKNNILRFDPALLIQVQLIKVA